MNCAKCGTELPENTRYCPKCGTVNEFEPTQPPAVKSKTKPLIYAIAGAAAIALIALVIVVLAQRGQNVTNAPGGVPGPPGNVLMAPPGAPSDGNITSAPPGNPGNGDNSPSSVPKMKPTKEMLDYLAYVKKIEEHRQMLLKDTTSALTIAAVGGTSQSIMNMIDMASDPDNAELKDPLQDAKTELNRQYKNWISTLEFFDKKTAPAECREFSGAYRAVIYSETKAIGEIAAGFNSVSMTSSQDMSKLLAALEKMKKDPSIQKNIDAAADAADGQLNHMVSIYDMPKPFDVPREQQGGGSIMGF